MSSIYYMKTLQSFFCRCRKEAAKFIDEIRDNMYQANRTWLKSVRRHLRKSLLDGIIEASSKSKPLSFLSHPIPECSCLRHDSFEVSKNSSSSLSSQVWKTLDVSHKCPAWMDTTSPVSQSKDKENEDDGDDDDSVSGLFFKQSGGNNEGEGGEVTTKEENQFEDQEELEGGER